MRKHPLTAVAMMMLVTVALSTVAVAQQANRTTTFTPLGLFPLCSEAEPGEFCEDFPLTTAVDISADGKSIVGMHAFFGGAYIWTRNEGVRTIGPVSGAPYFYGGKKITGTPVVGPNFDFSQSAMYTGGFFPDQGWNLIPNADKFAPCDSSGQSVHGGGNGRYVVGLTWLDENLDGQGCEGASGFISDGITTQVLSNSVNNDSTRGNAVNQDGSVVVGWMQTSSREAAKWVNGVQEFMCPNPTGLGGDIFCTEGWDVTPDGELMLTSGADITVSFNTRAQIVDQAGNMLELPFPADAIPSPDDTFSPRAISDDGNTVVGQYGGSGFFGSPPYPVFWKRELNKTIDLQVFLLEQGLDDLFFWFLEDATVVNANGTVIGGQGTNPDQWLEAYVVDMQRIKVCHEEESGDGTRTLFANWTSAAEHVAHGDALAACEFTEPGAASRAVQEMLQRRTLRQAPDADNRFSKELLNHRQAQVGGRTYPSLDAFWGRSELSPAQLRERQIQSLAKRLKNAGR